MVGGAVTQHWGRLAGEGGVDGLAVGAVRPGQHRAAGRVDQLDHDRPLAAEVHAAPGFALGPQQGHHVAEAHDLAGAVQAPAPDDLVADLRLAHARLAAAEQRADSERGGVLAGQFLAPVGQVGAERGGG